MRIETYFGVVEIWTFIIYSGLRIWLWLDINCSIEIFMMAWFEISCEFYVERYEV